MQQIFWSDNIYYRGKGQLDEVYQTKIIQTKNCEHWKLEQETNYWKNSVGHSASAEGNGQSILWMEEGSQLEMSIVQFCQQMLSDQLRFSSSLFFGPEMLIVSLFTDATHPPE